MSSPMIDDPEFMFTAGAEPLWHFCNFAMKALVKRLLTAQAGTILHCVTELATRSRRLFPLCNSNFPKPQLIMYIFNKAHPSCEDSGDLSVEISIVTIQNLLETSTLCRINLFHLPQSTNCATRHRAMPDYLRRPVCLLPKRRATMEGE